MARTHQNGTVVKTPQGNQWVPPGGNPLPEWVPGVGYAPTPGPAAGSNNPLPGTSGVNAPIDAIEAAQAANRAAAAPKPSSTSSPRPAPAPAPAAAPRKPVVDSRGPDEYWRTDTDPFAAVGGGVRLADGSWVPAAHPLAQGPKWQGGGAAAPTTPAGPSGPTQADVAALARQRIIDLLESNTSPAAAELRASPEFAARSLANQRAFERNRAILAEQAAASGTNMSGGFDSGVLRLSQARGEDDAEFIGQLARQRIDAAREDIKQGIQFALNQGQFEQAQALERELAQLDAAVRREQIASQAKTAKSDIALRRELGLAGIGFNYDALQANLNQAGALALLNGAG